MIKTHIEKLNNQQKALFWIAIAAAFLCAILYGYFLNAAIVNVVEREKAEEKMARLNSQIADLEFSYISLKNVISLDLAYSLGYQNAEGAKFISRKSGGKEISFNQIR